MEQEKLQEAEYYYKMAMDITVRAYGIKHPEVAVRFNNLAFLYEKWEKYDEAEKLYL